METAGTPVYPNMNTTGDVTRHIYQRRPIDCCILAGETDAGGLDMMMPVAGLMMGMALRPRVAAGW